MKNLNKSLFLYVVIGVVVLSGLLAVFYKFPLFSSGNNVSLASAVILKPIVMPITTTVPVVSPKPVVSAPVSTSISSVSATTQMAPAVSVMSIGSMHHNYGGDDTGCGSPVSFGIGTTNFNTPPGQKCSLSSLTFNAPNYGFGYMIKVLPSGPTLINQTLSYFDLSNYNDSGTGVSVAVALPQPKLTAKRITNSLIQLSWTNTSSSESGFIIERRLGYNGAWSVIGNTLTGITTFNDKSPVVGNLNYYGVYGYTGNSSNPTNVSQISGDLLGNNTSIPGDGSTTFVDITPPTVPALTLSTYFIKSVNKGITAYIPGIHVDWVKESKDDDDNYKDGSFVAFGYNLYRVVPTGLESKIGSFGRQTLMQSDELEYNDTANNTLKVGSSYCYNASAYDLAMNVSGMSSKVCVTIGQPHL